MGFETKLKQLESDIDKFTSYDKFHFRGYYNTDLSKATSNTILDLNGGQEVQLELGDIVIDINNIEYMWDGQKYVQFPNEYIINQTVSNVDFTGHPIASSSSNKYTVSLSDNLESYSVSSPYDDEIAKIWERLNKTVSLVHNCQCCGASLTVEENKPVINCKYCGATYLVGAVRDKDRG